MTALVAGTFPAESLLDAGCGDGRFLAAVARVPNRPGRLVGCDISERILQTAAEAVAREGAPAEFVRANLEQLPFPDRSFDRVLSVQVIEHLLDPAAGIRELARVLQPGGTLVLSTDNTRSYFSRALNLPRTTLVRALHMRGRHAKVTFPHRSFTREEVVSAVQSCGLEITHVETFRFHIDGVETAPVQRALNAIDRAIPSHRWGDILAVVASKP
jgi:2-polyprenyl-3-methyl-5-hydroxy-6-metoxy-1,4-benzoquinol methylase